MQENEMMILPFFIVLLMMDNLKPWHRVPRSRKLYINIFSSTYITCFAVKTCIYFLCVDCKLEMVINTFTAWSCVLEFMLL